MITRRQFTLGLAALGANGLAFQGLAKTSLGKSGQPVVLNTAAGFGPLQADPEKLLDLPKGFTYDIISQFGDSMADGLHVPDNADGMGCFALDEHRVALVRNHELTPEDIALQPDTIGQHNTQKAYDKAGNDIALPGGTSTLIYNMTEQKLESEYLSLCGTIRNCAGGITPWGSWLSCEESVAVPGTENQKSHGWVFEVPAEHKGLVSPTPLKAMGRFNHEAAAVDPATGIVYMTEDRGDSLFYRFIPNKPGKLEQGGKLQALVIRTTPQFDTRNWVNAAMPLQTWLDVSWVDLKNPASLNDTLRKEGYASGAALFARGEGIHWGDGELYFCCTNGGHKQLGQIMRYQPDKERIQLFLESTDTSLFNFGDNLTVAPFGDLIVCEDQYTEIVDNHLRGVTPQGEVYPFAKLHAQTELAGACFSPDGSAMFVNLYSPARTLVIKGPWKPTKS